MFWCELFGRKGTSMLMSGACRLHLRYYVGDVGYIEVHDDGSFLVGLSL